MPNPSDESLMVAVAQGDFSAFEQLIERHQHGVWRTAWRMVGDYQAAEDLAQDAFLRILEAAERYRPSASFRTYLYRIVVHLCIDHQRKLRPVPQKDAGLSADPSSQAEERVVLDELSEAVQQTLAGLPSKQRSAIVLRYYQGLSTREIAEVMETSVKAVERLLARGRAKLQRRLEGHLA